MSHGARFGWVAAAWAVAFAGLHFFWGLGGDLGLAVSAGPDLAAERPAWFVAGGLWGVGLLCLIGALVGRALARGRAGRPIRIAGYLAGLILLVRAATVEFLLLGGSTLNDTVGPDHRFWTLTVWNPWFALGGVSFLAASLAYRTRRDA
ncbi:DUF3995 domain-containing protein [Actinoplanes palleronii]|uniref:DUF3995 domain-containing protein n=1 Tax=Actinoplanes palleronii TaxID=113570 RepID=A0ABQ4B970_9ACTN|nr:DUF3995 domain-containing protein [Actinoplanes palleronii]GIE67137.1 hypothetical protein Apa02nite_032450 [Actinoplanes palleronii]